MRRSILLILAMLAACVTAPAPALSVDLVLENVTVLDPETRRVESGRAVAIDEGRIVAILPAGSVVAADRVVDGRGAVVMPGFVEAHAHLREATDAALLDYLAAGITTYRDMNGRPQLLTWRDEIEAGTRIGPRMIVASPTIANISSPLQGFPTPATAEEGAERVDRFRTEGYDLLKIYSFIPPEAFRGLAQRATATGMRFAGHAPIGVSMEELFASGLWSLEHETGIAEAVATEASAAADAQDNRGVFQGVEVDLRKLRRYAAMAREHGVWTVATMVYWERVPPPGPARTAWNNPELRALGSRSRKQILKGLHDAGAPIAVGSDSDAGEHLTPDVYWDELALMVEAGLPNWAVLKAATSDGARMMGLADLGVLRAGAHADLVLLRCDPVADIACVRDPVAVISRGRVVAER